MDDRFDYIPGFAIPLDSLDFFNEAREAFQIGHEAKMTLSQSEIFDLCNGSVPEIRAGSTRFYMQDGMLWSTDTSKTACGLHCAIKDCSCRPVPNTYLCVGDSYKEDEYYNFKTSKSKRKTPADKTKALIEREEATESRAATTKSSPRNDATEKLLEVCENRCPENNISSHAPSALLGKSTCSTHKNLLTRRKRTNLTITNDDAINNEELQIHHQEMTIEEKKAAESVMEISIDSLTHYPVKKKCKIVAVETDKNSRNQVDDSMTEDPAEHFNSPQPKLLSAREHYEKHKSPSTKMRNKLKPPTVKFPIGKQDDKKKIKRRSTDKAARERDRAQLFDD